MIKFFKQHFVKRSMQNSEHVTLFFIILVSLYYFGYIFCNRSILFPHCYKEDKIEMNMVKLPISIFSIFHIFPNLHIFIVLYILIYLLKSNKISLRSHIWYLFFPLIHTNFLNCIGFYIFYYFNHKNFGEIYPGLIVIFILIFVLVYKCKTIGIIIVQFILSLFESFGMELMLPYLTKESANILSSLDLYHRYCFEYISYHFSRINNLKKENILISNQHYGGITFIKLNFNNFKFENFISIGLKTFLESMEETHFILYHELGHVLTDSNYYSCLINLFCHVIMITFILLDMNSTFYDDYNNINLIDDNIKILKFFEMCSRSYFLKILLDIITNTFSIINENWADDFAVDKDGNLINLYNFIYYTSKNYLKNNSESIFILHPKYFPFLTHPSLYHRYKRQEERIYSN